MPAAKKSKLLRAARPAYAPPHDTLIRTPFIETPVTLKRKDWKTLGTLVLATQGPAYASRLRDRANLAADPGERARLESRARIVEAAAVSPRETVEALEILHDLAFGKPRRRTNGKSKPRSNRR